VVRAVRRMSFPSGPAIGPERYVSSLPGGDALIVSQRELAEERIRGLVERAIARCGSAIAVARQVGVKPPTVSQWRSGARKPGAIHLLQIQELAQSGELNGTR
jgi:hypothetical protein